jgi:cysteinyl-tRNA synthetase
LGVDKEKISALVEQRKLAREAKDFQLADKIRQQLTGLGITLADGVHGTEWRRS